MSNLHFLKRLRTSRYLKSSQIFYYLLRRGLPARSVKVKELISLRTDARLVESIPVTGIYVSEVEFEFLNVSKDIEGNQIDWQPSDMSRLWQYNLHYFDFLREIERSLDNKKALINDWIQSNPQGSQPGWEPFTASLRIVNWITFFLTDMQDEEIPQTWTNSVFEQALWLSKNDEKHILANHYFENIKALMFAGVYFQGKTAAKWLKKSQQLLREQLHEQFLQDGGHYEGSPQYHCLMLENCLDLYNLIANNRAVCDLKLQAVLKNQIEYSLHWLSDMHYHNGEIPLFNDAANNIAPNYFELSQYASRLFLYEPEASIVSGGKLIDLYASGYYGIEAGLDKFLIDCGDISPGYQPGHTHCDFLSYELAFDDHMIVVDSGVYEYTQGEMRDYVRSTKAHNTVSVDGDEQSEIWATFRVARRAKKLFADIAENNHGAVFKGGYEGFYGVSGKAKHLRDVDMQLNDAGNAISSITVKDVVQFKGKYPVESFIHLHPAITCNDDGAGNIELNCYGELVANIIVSNELSYEVSTSYYCPEFGKRIENLVIIMSQSGNSRVTMDYQIIKA